MDVYCSQCGSKIEDDDTFCTTCGAYIDQKPQSSSLLQDSKPPKSYRNTAIALIAAIILLTAGMFGFVYFFTFDGDKFVADEYVLYGDGAVGSGIISVVNDPLDINPLDDSSIVTLTFEKYNSGNHDWGIKSLDQSFYYTYEDPLSPNYYYDEREYEVPEGATFSENGKSMTCTLSPGHYSVKVAVYFQTYTGSFVVGGEVTQNYDWSFDIPDGPEDSFNLDFSFQYGECVTGILYDGPRGYIDFDELDTVFKKYVYDGSAVIEDLESKLRILYDGSIFSLYEDEYYYASFILAFVQQVIDYYPADFSDDFILDKEMSADKRIYGTEEYWAFPTETIMQGAGDCEDTSFLCAALFKAANLDAALLILPGHMMAGVYLEYGISSVYYPYYPTTSDEYVISEDIFDSETIKIKTYYGCETTTDNQYLLGYTSLMEEIGGIEYKLSEWVPSGEFSTYPKTYGFYPV
jgi:hypothetical protein